MIWGHPGKGDRPLRMSYLFVMSVNSIFVAAANFNRAVAATFRTAPMLAWEMTTGICLLPIAVLVSAFGYVDVSLIILSGCVFAIGNGVLHWVQRWVKRNRQDDGDL